MYRIFAIMTALFISHSLHAQPVAGKTLAVRGSVNAQSQESQESRKLKRRSPIYSDDIIATGTKGKAQLRMTDGGMIALKENTELLISSYEFSDGPEKGSVVMELVKGGLRSVTGALKAETGDYKLKTPVGSIGIRGTHYEVEIVSGTLWVAVWDGAVDLDVTSGPQAGSRLSLGNTEQYSYASIDAGGNVNTYIAPPETFESGMTTEADDVEEEEETEEETTEESSEQEQSSDEQAASQSQNANQQSQSNESTDDSANEDKDTEKDSQPTQNTNTEPNKNTNRQTVTVVATPSSQPDELSDTLSDNEQSDFDNTLDQADSDADQESVIAQAEQNENTQFAPDDDLPFATETFNEVEDTSIAELLEQRTGTFTYDQLSSVEVNSSAGEVSNFQLAITVDFDNSSVPGGVMSFTDNGGEWFATFDGFIHSAGFDLDFSKVTHGNNLGTGTLDASFLNGLDSILGNFTLEENLNPDINVSGSFIIK